MKDFDLYEYYRLLMEFPQENLILERSTGEIFVSKHFLKLGDDIGICFQE